MDAIFFAIKYIALNPPLLKLLEVVLSKKKKKNANFAPFKVKRGISYFFSIKNKLKKKHSHKKTQ